MKSLSSSSSKQKNQSKFSSKTNTDNKSQKFQGEPYIFYDTWLTRLNAIRLLKNKNNLDSLRILIVEVIRSQNQMQLVDFKVDILIEFNLENLRFCFHNNFGAEQISTFMSIINYVFNVSLSKKLTASDSFEKLENIVDRHTKQVPPYAIKIFTDEEKELILEHSRGIYKFFLMYEISLTKFIDYNIFTIEPFTKFMDQTDLWEGETASKEDIYNIEVLKGYITIEEEEQSEHTHPKEGEAQEGDEPNVKGEGEKDQKNSEDEQLALEDELNEENNPQPHDSNRSKKEDEQQEDEEFDLTRKIVESKIQEAKDQFVEEDLRLLDSKFEERMSSPKKGRRKKDKH